MSDKPDDIPQDVWNEALRLWRDEEADPGEVIIARAIMAAEKRGKDATIAEVTHLLQDVADGVLEADGRTDDGIIDMQIVRDIRAFVAAPSPD